ncbi:Pentatricopeptide repeat-containing protein At5g08510 [Linum grandiflorum]
MHTCFAKSGFASDFIACTALVDAYAKLKLMRTARQLFDKMPVRDVPTWNSLIAGYGKCGDMEAALEMFNSMPRKSVVSWTAMISGYSQNGLYANAVEFFLKMEDQGSTVRPNEVTIASVLPACANLGALDVGERIDAYARGNGLLKNLYVSNALLEMYSRCGQIHVARRVFDEMGNRRNLCSWNSMIMGLAVHGRSSDALSLYDEMLVKRRNCTRRVTFVGLLLACTHGGMVSKGKKLLESMEADFGISPKLEHSGCMVDLLGPESCNKLMIFHNNVELAEVSAEALFELEPWNPGNYVILSNVYASKGRWDGVARLRKMMKGGQITKAAGYSFVEVAGRVHKFMVGDGLHPRSDEVYRLLEVIYSKMGRQRHGLMRPGVCRSVGLVMARPIFVGNFEFETRQSELERLFSKYGRVERVDMKSGFAFVYFEDDRDASDAIRGLDQVPFGYDRRRLSVEWARGERGRQQKEGSRYQRPTKTLFVINFDPVRTRVEDIKRHFEPYGEVTNVRIRRNFAFVQFETQEDATKALESTHLSKILDRVVSVEYALRDDDASPRRGSYRSPSPVYRRRPSPDYGRPLSPVYDKYNGAAYDRRASPDYNRGASPYRGRNRSPVYDRYRSRSPIRRSRT